MRNIKKEKTPRTEIPYRRFDQPFRFVSMIPGNGITIKQDRNGVCFISTDDGMSLSNLVAGDNISLEYTEDGQVIVSAVNTVTDIAAGQNVTIDIDPETGTAVINSVVDGTTNEHYKGVFDTPADLIAAVENPEPGDYGMVKDVVFSDGDPESSWSGSYKYCFYIDGAWKVVDQMLTFTNNPELLQQFYSVGGGSPVIYLHTVAFTGDFRDLNNIPIVATPVVTVEGTTVTATCATEGAEIWYTTDGTMPHVNGTRYSGPITAAIATTYRFVGIKNGMINSLESVASADYQLDAPTVSLDWTNGEITMENPNVDGSDNPVGAVYYTTDGSEPTSLSTLYTVPFVITAATNFKAKVINTNDNHESAVTEQSYSKITVNHGSRDANTITGVWHVTFNTDPAGCEQHFTDDGTTPDYDSPEMEVIDYDYYGGVKVIKVIAFSEGYIPSDVQTYSYGEVKPVSPPVNFDPDSRTVSLVDSYNQTGNTIVGIISGLFSAVALSAGDTRFRCRIYYTLDGSTPTDQSTLFTGPFEVKGNETVKAVVVAYGRYSSDVTTRALQIVPAPEPSLNSATGAITLTNPSGVGTIHFTLDGSTPTADSPVYEEPIVNNVLSTVTVKSIVITESGESEVTTTTVTRLKWNNKYPLVNTNVSYRYDIGEMTFTPPTAENGADLYYSIGGVDWYPYTGTLTSDLFDSGNPINVYFQERMDGRLPNYTSSLSFGYKTPSAPTITYDAGAVTLALSGNTANIPLQTNNNVPTVGARIYYTTDGTEPTDQSTLYTGPFRYVTGNPVKAITICYGQHSSTVSTAYPVMVSAFPPQGGVANASAPLVRAGSSVVLEAVPATDWGFVNWEDGNTDATRTMTVNAAVNMAARFNPYFDLTVLSDDPTMGTVSGGGRYLAQTEVEISATPNTGYGFVRWSDGNTNATRTVTITGDTTLTAYFAALYTLTVQANDTTMGTVSGGGQYVSGSQVTITATPNAGYEFVQWSDGNTSASRVVTVTGNTTLTATFRALYTLTVQANDPDMGTVSGGGQYASGTQVNISATPNTGYEFVQWSDGNTSASRVVTVTGNTTLTATFQSAVIEPLNFTSPDGGSVSLNKVGNPALIDLEYSYDNLTWSDWTDPMGMGTLSLYLNAGETVYIRNKNMAGTALNMSTIDYYYFSLPSNTVAAGDVRSLVSSEFRFVSITDYMFCRLFYNCYGLVKAPLLDFNLDQSHCGEEMFYGCSSLNYLKTTASSVVDMWNESTINNWLENVSMSGDFYCYQSLQIPTGSSGIPSGWTRHNLD